MKRLLLLVAVLALLTPAVAQQAGLKATFDTLWVRVAVGESIALNLIRAAGDSWAAMPKWYIDSMVAAGTDTLAFHHNNPADSSETLYAKSAVIDTTAPRAGYASTVAGNAWVRDTVNAMRFYSRWYAGGTTPQPDETTQVYVLSIGGGAKSATTAPCLDFYELDTLLTDTVRRFTIDAADGFVVYRKQGHNSLINWDGFENVDTVHKDVSGNPARRAFHGWAWNDTGMSGGVGMSGIWQYESTRVVAMAESANGGTNSFVAAIGSATGNFADTSYMSSTLGFYTNAAAGFVGVGAVVPGTVIDWYGDSSAFPTGYVLCDGTRKFKTAAGDSLVTPDLRNFFVVGASIDTGNGIPMSSIEDTTGAVAKATGGSQKYTPAGAVSAHTTDGAEPTFAVEPAEGGYATHSFTGSRAVLVQPYVACWKLVKSRTY